MRSHRLPSHLDEQTEKVYLTLLSYADLRGLVTRCSWTSLMDYAGCPKQSDAERAIDLLVEADVIKVLAKTSKTRHYQILGNFTRDIELAQEFRSANSPRVAQLENERSGVYLAQKNLRNGLSASAVPYVVIENIEPLRKTNTVDYPRWSFSMRIPDVILIRHCVYTLKGNNPRVFGPARRMNGQFIYDIELDPTLEDHLRKILASTVSAEDFPDETEAAV